MIHSDSDFTKKIESKEMQVSWKYRGEFVIFKIQSKSSGWFAIGFNESSELKGTKLIMGAIERKKAILSERHIIEPGNHKSLTELGEAEEIKILDFSESNQQKQITFQVPIASKNKYVKNLSKGTRLHLLIAYSLENDFLHHSIYRTSAEIEL